MTTVRSSFKISRAFPVYKNILKRSVGTMLFYWALMFVFMPLQYILELVKYYEDNMYPLPSWYLFGPAQMFNGFSITFFTAIALVAPVIITTALFSYMHTKRSVDVYHSLPLTRDELYVVHTAVSATVVVIPLVVNFLIVAAAACASPVKNSGAVLTEMLCWIAISLVIVAVTAFAAVNSGTSFDTAIFSVGLNISLLAIYFTIMLISELMLYGFNFSNDCAELGCKLSPFSLIALRQSYSSEIEPLAKTNIAIALWFLAGIAIFIAGMLFYRRRPSEDAEMVGNMGPVQIYLRSAGTLAAGTLLGFMFCAMFEYESDIATLVASFLGSIVVYFIGDALLSRSVRSLFKALPKALLTASGVAAVILVIMLGGAGYESRVPALDSVESVTLRGYRGRFDSQPNITYSYSSGVMFESEEAVQLILDAHAAQCVSEDKVDDYAYHTASLNVEYDLGGRTMSRNYNVVCDDTYKSLFALETTPEFISKNHPLFSIESNQISYVSAQNIIGTEKKTLELTDEQKQQLFEAVKADILAQPVPESGKQGLGYLTFEIKYLPRNYSYTLAYGNKAVSEVTVITEGSSHTYSENLSDSEYNYSDSTVLLTDDYTNTIAFLKELGAADILKNDISAVKKAYIGVAGWQIDGMGNAVNETHIDCISSIDDDIYYMLREEGVMADDLAYTQISGEQLSAAEDKLLNIIAPYNDTYIVVAVVNENQHGNEEISGYYFAPITAFDNDTVDKMLENSREWYGERMIERLRLSIDR